MKRTSFVLLLNFCFSFVIAGRTIHVFVPLCDNIHQGIVKVPGKIGNGQDPVNNLYWGCAFGVKTFFKRSPDWILIKVIAHPQPGILERVLFKHKLSDTYLLADAYDGAKIQQCTIDFLNASAGLNPLIVRTDSLVLRFGGAASLICYTGHNGLMDFSLNQYPEPQNSAQRDVIILACFSKSYFTKAINHVRANPVLWSTHLMSPEAYTLMAAIAGWILKEDGEQIRTRAAHAYNQYQRCGEKASRNLLVTGR